MSSIPYTGSIKGNLGWGVFLTGLGSLGAYIGYYDIVPPSEGQHFLTKGNHLQEYSPHASGLVIAASTATAARGLWVIWNGAVVPSYENACDFGTRQYEWLKSYRCRADGMAAVTGVAAGLVGVGASVASAYGVVSPVTYGISSAVLAGAGGYYLNTTNGRSSIATSPSVNSSISSGVVLQGPLNITEDHPLHLDAEFHISPPSDPTLRFTSVGAAFVGYSCSEEYLRQHSNDFLEKSGEELRQAFQTIEQEDLNPNHQNIHPNLEANRRLLLSQLLDHKFGIGKGSSMTPEQAAFRKALKQTKKNLTHPALGTLTSEAVTNALKMAYDKVVAEDTAAARARSSLPQQSRGVSFQNTSTPSGRTFGRTRDDDGFNVNVYNS